MATVNVEDGLMAHKEEKRYATIDSPGATQQTANTNPEDVDYKKRYDDLKRYYDDKLNDWKTERADLEQRIKSAHPSYQPPKSAEELEKFREENPEVYGIAETLAHLRANEEIKKVQEEIEGLKELKNKFGREAAFRELKSYHPDYEEIKADPSFKEWAREQPDQIKSWLFGSDLNAKLAAKAINLFKAERRVANKGEETRPKNTGAQAVNVRSSVDTEGKSPKIWSRAEIEKLSLRDFELNKDDINQAMKEGRIRR